MTHLPRRDFLVAAGALTGAGLLTRRGEAAAAHPPERTPVLRVAHLTDVHVQPELGAEAGFAACLSHVQSRTGSDKPDLILFGGDNVMDVMGTTAERGREQLACWNRVLKSECSLPHETVIGNHDVWGWKKDRSSTTGSEDLWGKKWALDAFGLPARYRFFDRAGWRFVILDSTHPVEASDPNFEHTYTGKLDDEQFAWLARTLAETPKTMPVCVVSHIPILSMSVVFDGDNEKTGDWVVPGAWFHIDARRIKDLFVKHPNVKLCLSGHVHQVDRVDFLGVTYLCHGAVSGGWWKGRNYECTNGYGLVNLYADGTFTHEYSEFAWTPRE